jgi:hypothetical protein
MKVRLEAQDPSGKWIAIFPSQLDQMIQQGAPVRATEVEYDDVAAATLDSDIGILLSVLHDFEEAVGETIDDTDGVVAQIEHDHKARAALRSLDIAATPREVALEKAARDFIAKVERGDARSRHSYMDFQAALALPGGDAAERKVMSRDEATHLVLDLVSAVRDLEGRYSRSNREDYEALRERVIEALFDTELDKAKEK